jgi:hypothetical protein
MIRMRVQWFVCVVLLLLLWPAVAGWAESARPPRLIVVVVIDQFRADYLTRFRDQFGPDGFNRLLREGANFTSCYYPYAGTETGPGHTTLATGTTPNRHGIASNDWYDFSKGRDVEAVEDDAYPQVGTPNQKGVSPHNLVGTTLADELRLATEGKAKVFGVAIKDRAAVFSTGHTASGAYWYDSQTGTVVTSRYYREALPAWVVAFNQQHGAASYYGKDWKAGEQVFVEMKSKSGQPDEEFFRLFPYTPYGNQIAVDFARALVDQEGLGADEVTDFLFVGFSSNDYVGHTWGPYSDQVADITLRSDKQIAELLHFLDEKVGAGNYWVALSGDHGVAPTIAQSRARGINAKEMARDAQHNAVQEALAARWGEEQWLASKQSLVFNRQALEKHGISLQEAAHVAGQALLGVDGILGYVAGKESTLDAATTRMVRLSTYPGRSPDVQVVLEPFALVRYREGGTGHGTPHSYDTHVPLVLFGPAFRAGTYEEKVATIDLASTLAAALGINPPARASGRVLVEGLAPAMAPH